MADDFPYADFEQNGIRILSPDQIEVLVVLRTRLFDAEAALAELVRLKDGPRDAAYGQNKEIAWSRARAVLAQIECGDAPAPCNCDDPVLHRGH